MREVPVPWNAAVAATPADGGRDDVLVPVDGLRGVRAGVPRRDARVIGDLIEDTLRVVIGRRQIVILRMRLAEIVAVGLTKANHVVFPLRQLRNGLAQRRTCHSKERDNNENRRDHWGPPSVRIEELPQPDFSDNGKQQQCP